MAFGESFLLRPRLGFSRLILTPLQEAAEFFYFPSREHASEKAKLLWLVKLRWVAITLFFLLCGPALATGGLSLKAVSSYLGVLALLLIFNLLSQLVIAETRRSVGPVVICFQLSFDLIALTALLATSGGYTNPFVALFFLNISLGGILISGRLAWPFLLLAHVLLGFLQFEYLLTSESLIQQKTMVEFLVHHLLAVGFWLVMRALGAYLERQNRRRNQTQIGLEKRDRLRALGALAAGFSHEFASPLNVAKIRIERLKRRFASEDLDEALRAVNMCESVIYQMNSSQIDSRNLDFKTIVVAHLLRDVLEAWLEGKRLLGEPVDIETFFDEDIKLSIPPINFAQVVVNLLDNAFEARPSGRIRVVLAASIDEVRVSVQDEGPGFCVSVLERLGEPFLTTKKDGSGLGLYVSDLFAQSLDGRLEVENLVPLGTRVSFVWPMKEGQQ